MEGFYKYTEEQGWNYAPNGVFNTNYELTKETKDDFNYPIDGWFWSDVEPEGYVS